MGTQKDKDADEQGHRQTGVQMDRGRDTNRHTQGIRDTDTDKDNFNGQLTKK
jgi:hypothetical protein